MGVWHSSPLHLSSLPSPSFFLLSPLPSNLYFFPLLNFSSVTSFADSLSVWQGGVYWCPRFTFPCAATLLEKKISLSQCAHRYLRAGM